MINFWGHLLEKSNVRLKDVCSPGVRVACRDQPLAEAAQVMLDSHVGALIVVERDNPRRPVGILTDRDIVRGQLARAADIFCLTVGDVMSPQPLCLAAELSLTAAIDKLNEKAVRRAPVLDASGALIGIVTLDDLLPAVSGQLSELADLLRLQARRENQESAPARQAQPRAQAPPDE
jgi:CBS domain-containing protein